MIRWILLCRNRRGFDLQESTSIGLSELLKYVLPFHQLQLELPMASCSEMHQELPSSRLFVPSLLRNDANGGQSPIGQLGQSTHIWLIQHLGDLERSYCRHIELIAGYFSSS
jgi:hypothetical protein